MLDRFGADIVTILTGIVGLAVIAVLVSKQAQTGTVINDLTSGFGTDIKDAVSPLGTS